MDSSPKKFATYQGSQGQENQRDSEQNFPDPDSPLRMIKSEIASPEPQLPYDLKVRVMKSNILDEPEDRYELSELKWKRFQQQVFLLLSDFESSKLALFLSIFSIIIICTDICFLLIEEDPNLDLPEDSWIKANMVITIYFAAELVGRLISYNAFDETFREFIRKPYNFCDILALNYSIFEIAFFLGEVFLDQRIKVLRIFVISRLIRVFKYSTFNKGLENLIKGLSESIQALTILFFFTMICVILISNFIYFAENEFSNNSEIQNIPEAIWWAIITITTVGYGDTVPKSFLGKVIGSFALVFGVLLLSLPVAIIGNKFQQIYMENQKEETQEQRKRTKQLCARSDNQDQKEFYNIILKLNELEEVNETIEKCLKNNQFLYRSITRDAQNLIEKIDLDNDDRVNGRGRNSSEYALKERVRLIKDQIRRIRKSKGH